MTDSMPKPTTAPMPRPDTETAALVRVPDGRHRRERAQRWLRPLLGVDLTNRLFARGPAPELPDDDLRAMRRNIDSCIGNEGGLANARRHAALVGASYLALDATGRARFLKLLARSYAPDPAAVDAAVRDWQIARASVVRDPEAEHRATARLRAASGAPRVALLEHFTALTDGVKLVVDMRAELLLQPEVRSDAALASLEGDVRELLEGWFNIGLLELVRISWDSPASLLEKLIAYEAVHAISSWDDLRNRLEPDRRCFAFVHPAMPSEPVIFVEVALTNGIATQITALLDEHAPVGDPRAADTAVFYGISNCQAGLAGVSFGDVLIKRVVEELRSELPNLQRFVTLSPMPGFAAWLRAQAESAAGASTHERTVADALSDEDRGSWPDLAALVACLEADDPPWTDDRGLAARLEAPLLRLAARYLVLAGHRDHPARALDPVAHFHLSNGARLERINHLANPSPAGRRASHAVMCNYRYELAHLVDNHRAYTSGTIPASNTVNGLLDPPKPKRRDRSV